MKRFQTAFLCLILLFSTLVFPVHGADEDYIIDSPDDLFPADTVIHGDLLISDNCPKIIALINVTVEGTLIVNADHPVDIHFQGQSGCQSIQLDSDAHLFGGTHGSVVVDAGFGSLYDAQAESLTLYRAGAFFFADGEFGSVTMDAEGCFLGGKHHAGSLTVLSPECRYCGVYDSIAEDFTQPEEETYTPENYGVEATLSLNRTTVTPAESVLHGTLTFDKVPDEIAGDYRIYWYFDSMFVGNEWHVDVSEGNKVEFEASAHFEDGKTGFTVWAELINGDDDDLKLRFAQPVSVKDYSTAEYSSMESSEYIHPYEIHLLRNQNTIIVYGKDKDGKYTKIVNVFVCSTGKFNPTPLGNFEINLQMRWNTLGGDVLGQYISQFYGNVLFHSVPYRTKNKADLEWDEYNLLGSPASSGCVRLAACDARWIYVHCSKGTPVSVYDSDTCPVEIPVPIKINEDSIYRGWDPTDPDPDNPTSNSDIPKTGPVKTDWTVRLHRPEPLFQ